MQARLFFLAVALAITSGPLLTNTMAAAPSIELQTIAVVGGRPDDVAVDATRHLVWGDLATNSVRRLWGGRIQLLASGIDVPEGIVSLGKGSLLVAEQGRDRIDRIAGDRHLSVLHRLVPVAGQEGVDGIGLDARNNRLLIPDSPRGRVLAFNLSTGRVKVLATGLCRPVDAVIGGAGDLLVPDEHLATIVSISPGGRVTHHGTFNTPDDVAVDRKGRVWVTTLGDGGLWTGSSGGTFRRLLVGLSNPQGLTLDACGDPIIVEQGKARIERVIQSPKARTCAL